MVYNSIYSVSCSTNENDNCVVAAVRVTDRHQRLLSLVVAGFESAKKFCLKELQMINVMKCTYSLLPLSLVSRVAAMTRRTLLIMKALIVVVFVLGLTACPPDIVSMGTTIKILDLEDEDGEIYSGNIPKGTKTIIVTLPDEYKLPEESTLLTETYENDQEKFDAACYKTSTRGELEEKTLIKFKMTPKLTLSKGAEVGSDSELKNDGTKQTFAANTYLGLNILNGSKITKYSVFVGTKAQFDAIEQAGDPSSTYIERFDLFGPDYKQISEYTVITHASNQNNDKNVITIVLKPGTPRIKGGDKGGYTQIRLEAPTTVAAVTPASGSLPENFEPNEPIPFEPSELDITYTVYPKEQEPDSLFARTYSVILLRADALPDDPDAPPEETDTINPGGDKKNPWGD
jgi:hypothetical protein